MDLWQWALAVFLGLSLAASTGLNTFLPLLCLSMAAKWHLGGIVLQGPFAWLGSDAALIALAIATVAEVIADKFPAVDHALDALGTLVRPIVGSAAFAAALGHADLPTAALLGMIVGGTTTFGVHAAKAGTRVASTTTTMGLANPALSAAEDATAVGLSLTGIFLPVLVPLALICLGAIAWQLLRRLPSKRK